MRLGRIFILGFAFWMSIGSSQADIFAPLSASRTGADQLFENSVSSPLIPLIQATKKTLDLEIYTMKDPNVLEAIRTAMSNHVRVRIVQTANMIDPCKVFNPIETDDDPACVVLKKFVVEVNAKGGTYVPFSRQLCGVPGSNCYQHGKILISDGGRALISTGNFDASNICDLEQKPDKCNRDFTVLTSDSGVVRELESVFENDLTQSPYNLNRVLESGATSRLTVSPYSLDPLVAFIQSAKKTIQIENQYLKDPTVNEALIAAAKRNVQVFVMVESIAAFGKPDPVHDATPIAKWTNIFTSFDKAGIHTRVFNSSMRVNGKPGYLHAKAILVDGVHAWVGSVNGSTTSLTDNREFGIFSDDSAFVKKLGVSLYGDFQDTRAETWQQSLVGKKDSGKVTGDPDDNFVLN